MLVVLRCDGDDRVGVGHVARCLQIASALKRRGVRCELVGRVDGAASELVESADIPTRHPGGRAPLGVPDGADAVLVDSYELPLEEQAAAARERPLAAIVDGSRAPEGATLLSYHLDAPERLGRGGLLGPDYAPVGADYAAARRPRDDCRLLITVGGGTAGSPALDVVLAAASDPTLDLFVAARLRPSGLAPEVPCGWDRDGLAERVRWADLAVSAAGSTAYELACAGVPAVLLAVADNQLQVAATFADAGMAISLDARADVRPAKVARALQEARWSASRLGANGPAVIDGYGSFRAADGLLASFRGELPPEPLRYRPATLDDRDLLHVWRNDPDVRAVSRTSDPIDVEHHARWLSATLADPARTLLIAEKAGGPVATVRFDRDGEEAEISVTVAPAQRGAGVGSRVIREASELQLASHSRIRRVVADIAEKNPVSRKAFERASYSPAGREAGPGRVLLAFAFD